MGTATSYTSDAIDAQQGAQDAQIQAVDDAGIATASVNAAGHLIITRNDGSSIDAGQITGVTGSIVMYGGVSAPTGWLLCDGTAVSRTTYAALFALLGTRFGAGDGSTTFNVPNMQARTPRMDTANLGVAGGSATHSHAIPNHDHAMQGGSTPALARIRLVTGPNSNLSMQRASASAWTNTHIFDVGGGGAIHGDTGGSNDGAVIEGQTGATGITEGAGSSLDPYLNLNFIIKT